MNRETLKTILGLAVIVLIVVATFLYGNAQRQAQLKRDQDVRSQQTATSTNPSAAQSPNVAPVGSPAANSIQGGQASSAATTAAGTTTSPIPQTGPTNTSLLGLAALAGALVTWRRSRRAVLAAARARF